LGEGAVHAGADGVAAEAEKDLSAGFFYGAGKSDIFEQICGDGGMSADGIIGLAGDEHVLAVGGCGGRGGIAHLRGTKAGGQFGEDHGHGGLLPKAFYYLLGRVGKQGRTVTFGFFDTSRQGSGQMSGVGVGE
jgi:hypothetical protein